MKGKCIFSITIVITLAALAAAALVYSLNSMEGSLPLLKFEANPQGAMKSLFFLFGIGNIFFMHIRNNNALRIIVEITYNLVVTFSFEKWGIYMAGLERGYEAAGGEYCLIFVVSWAAGMAIDHLFDSLEDFKYKQAYQKERS